MTSGEKDRDGPPPADDEGRRLLFGLSTGGERQVPEPDLGRTLDRSDKTASQSPPTASSAAKGGAGPDDAPALAQILASIDSNQQRILALLANLGAKPAAGGDLAEASRTIAEATEWANNIKAAMAVHLEAAGQLIEGLKGGQHDFDTAVAALKGREEGLAKQLQTFAEYTGALDTLLKRLDRRSAELEGVKQELAGNYAAWTRDFETVLPELRTLSGRLDQGDHMVTRLSGVIKTWTDTMLKALKSNADAQRTAAERTSGNVGKLTEAGDAFLERFDTGWQEALAGFRREWKRTRRWTVPLLAAALVLAVPMAALMGALGQSEFGVFARHNDTQGWRREFLERYGERLKACAAKALNTKSVVRCSFDVTWQ